MLMHTFPKSYALLGDSEVQCIDRGTLGQAHLKFNFRGVLAS